jgi:Fic family protein
MITKNDIFRQSLNLSRTTATKYLKLLVANGFLEETKKGKETIYLNIQLYNIFEK